MTPAAPSSGFEDQHIIRLDYQADFLGLDGPWRRSSGIEHIAVRQAVLAAEDAAGAVAHAVAGGVADRRLGGFDDHLDNPAGAAAEFAFTAGIGAEFGTAGETGAADP